MRDPYGTLTGPLWIGFPRFVMFPAVQQIFPTTICTNYNMYELPASCVRFVSVVAIVLALCLLCPRCVRCDWCVQRVHYVHGVLCARVTSVVPVTSDLCLLLALCSLCACRCVHCLCRCVCVLRPSRFVRCVLSTTCPLCLVRPLSPVHAWVAESQKRMPPN